MCLEFARTVGLALATLRFAMIVPLRATNRPRAMLGTIAALVLFCVCFICFFGALGCDLAGTHDVELVYTAPPVAPRSSADAGPPRDREDEEDALREAVERRLSPAHVTADIDVDDRQLRITVASEEATIVEELLRWRGGLTFYRLAPSVAPPASNGKGVTESKDDDGAYLVGPAGAIFDATLAAQPDEGHAVLNEWLDVRRARTRTVALPPVTDLDEGIASIDRAEDGHALAIHFTTSAQKTLAAALTGAAGERIAIARARSVLAVGPLRSDAIDPLLISFGSDLYSYTRAHRTKLYLSTPTLPVLAPAEVEHLPKNVMLAFSCFVLPMLLSFSWLFFVRRFDRAQPEPIWLVLATFVIGGVSAFGAGLMEGLLETLTPYLSPDLMTLGGQLRAFPFALIVFTIVVGMSEEGAKLFGAWSLAYHRREFDEPVDGIVYGAASALGFAAVENIKYFTSGRLSASLVAVRTFTSIPAHLFFGAIWGYALGQKLVSKKTSLLGFFLLAALAHGAFDTFLSIDGLSLFAMALNFGLAIVFFVLLRKSLRHGAITAEMASVPSSSRKFFRAGTPGAFAVYAVAMHVIAFVLLVLGGWIEHTRQRVGFGFVGIASGAILLLGFAAYGLTQAMPLDVVLDAYGITFAGAARKWNHIRSVERRAHIGSLGVRAEVWLRSTDGDIRLGPGDPTVMESLAQAIEDGLARRAYREPAP